MDDDGGRRLVAVALVVAQAKGAQPSAPQRRPDVRFLATPDNVVDAMLDLAGVTSADVVYDLGSGDGRIPIAAARRFGARGVGIEIDPVLVRQSEENARKAGVDGLVRFVTEDLFQADIREATVVTLFLLPWMNIDLIPKFQSQLRPGARIVAHHFAMGDRWLPDETHDVNGLDISTSGEFRLRQPTVDEAGSYVHPMNGQRARLGGLALSMSSMYCATSARPIVDDMRYRSTSLARFDGGAFTSVTGRTANQSSPLSA